MAFSRKARTALRTKRAEANKETKPYWEGYWSDDGSCPFPAGSEDAAQWGKGWNDRQEEAA